MRSVTDTTTVSNGVQLKQLQREYRNMEMNRKVYADQVNRVVKRQQNTIDKLRKENGLLKEEVNLSTRQENGSSLHQQQEQSAKARDQIRRLQKKIGSEQQKFDKVSKLVESMRHQVLYQKKNMGGVHAPKDNQELVQKQIRILENRLHTSQSKFNRTLAQNKIYRDEIDDLRRERLIFDDIYRKIEKEHADKKKQMTETIEWSNQAYQQRDDFHRQIRELQEKNRQEMEAHRKAMAESQHRIDEIIGTGRTDPTSSISSTYKERVAGCRTIETNVIGREYERRKEDPAVDVHSNQLWENCEEAMRKIQAATGFSDPNKLVDTFLSRENRNFSLFNHVNEQHDEIERMQQVYENSRERELALDDECCGDGQHQGQRCNDKDILMRKSANSNDTDIDHRRLMQSYEAKCLLTRKIISAVRFHVQTLYTKIGCNTKTPSECYDMIMTEGNIIQSLATIEEHADRILQEYAAVVQDGKSSMVSQISKGSGQIVQSQNSIIHGKHEPKLSLLMQHAMRMGVLIASDQDHMQIGFADLQHSSDEDSVSNQKASDEQIRGSIGHRNFHIHKSEQE
ncbi:unnamed protein product [Albugo candida]|uniref:ODAD1 central coiled coil region domain-containing protein n=1 Tax=Albugo candida TaxID=65357 RepID=A0A024GGT8_9STRA|nr:unnamed protein product [Albugo candida]|eukprot:CCI46107.1 unnamed protein product [Albugo candida]